jgi:hypothetical protein
MSKSGCDAMPIESPSSIQSDSPSEFVRRYADTASRPSRSNAGSTKLFGIEPSRGRARGREATLATGRS